MTEPLPYVVKLRTIAGDDAPPVITEVRCLAYDPVSACTQAILQTLGTSGTDSDRCKVESVGPDIETWRKMRDEEKQRDAKKQGVATARGSAGQPSSS